MTRNELLNQRYNIFSQNGEDGVINYLLNLFNIKDGQFCEFGAWDGKYLSNTFNLLQNKNWSGVYIEADEEKFKDLVNTKNQFPDKLEIFQSLVLPDGENTLDKILSKTSLKQDFELLSIDIDGLDYLIWESFKNYKPKLVIIESQAGLKPGDLTKPSFPYTLDYTTGASFTSLCNLGIEKGYYPLVAFGNMFFGEIEFLKSNNYQLETDINSLYSDHWEIWKYSVA
jgi:hypothetical protein